MFRLVCALQGLALAFSLTPLDHDDAISLVRVAHAASQDVVRDVWDRDDPQVADLLCAAPKRTGHMTKHSDISNSLIMPPGTVVNEAKANNIPIYAGCGVRSNVHYARLQASDHTVYMLSGKIQITLRR